MTGGDRRPRVAVFYPYFAGGGAELVALATLEALRDGCDLTLFTLSPPDVARLERVYPNASVLREVRCETLLPREGGRRLARVVVDHPAVRRVVLHLVLRRLRALRSRFDLAISAYNAADLGPPGLQYVHWVRVVEGPRAVQRLFGFSPERLLRNSTLANSRSTAAAAEECYGIRPHVLYPPVYPTPPGLPWEERDDAFVCSGRLVEAKAQDAAIDIVRRVRAAGHDVTLHLTGGAAGPARRRYRRKLQRLVSANAPWVRLHEGLSRADYLALLGRCRYGLHPKREPFGIVVAEMLQSGAVPFVRDGGGQVEIVGPECGELQYHRREEAVRKIVALLGDEGARLRLRRHLAARRDRFSPTAFATGMRSAVAGVLELGATEPSGEKPGR